ncbi:MAG: 4-oxalocrotonate decarboxylase [Solirubrobacterales bacterium]|nr:4-oxalocrotonate decarboxylase [Solirubrobacterales bacterium]
MPDLDAIADRLAAAVEQVTDIERFTATEPDLTIEQAYDVQWRGIERRLAAGERIVGAKLGLTSRAKQRQMSVDDPLYGWLTDAMVHEAATPLPLDRLIHPRVEPEIAFLLGEELAGPTTVVEVLAATEAVFGALEVIDSRYRDFDFRLPDVVADNASASAASLIVGPVAAAPADVGDLRLLGCVLRRDGELVATAAGAAVMEHPAAAVAWLANRLAEQGRTLPAGSLILSGALTDAVAIGAGQTVSAEFDGLGTVTAAA